MPRQIDDIEIVKNIASQESGLECFISLNGGLRSSKHVWYYPEDESFYVLAEIDGHEFECTEDELMDSFFGEALSKGAVFMY